MMSIEHNGITAEERQRYFEQLCSMDEQEFLKLWKNSEVYAKLQKLAERHSLFKRACIDCRIRRKNE